jgi:hypothetical protein
MRHTDALVLAAVGLAGSGLTVLVGLLRSERPTLPWHPSKAEVLAGGDVVNLELRT